MFRKSILVLLLFLMTFSISLFLDLSHSQAAITQEKTIVYYFHGNMRCRTCNKIETYTKEAINAGFAGELTDGLLEIRIINTDKSENEHFIKDFQLTNRAVVLVRSRGGQPEKWKNLDRIWLLVRKKEAFQSYINDEIQLFMAVDE
ncbi:MAG: nitrophenyl compound nitroreductase subunit ArsF family protein [Pseudomonadota bacterium]|nr:nitrophenyl compound nitroreductase subunit ArsF family protein [Pseudomonadota bacterium]